MPDLSTHQLETKPVGLPSATQKVLIFNEHVKYLAEQAPKNYELLTVKKPQQALEHLEKTPGFKVLVVGKDQLSILKRALILQPKCMIIVIDDNSNQLECAYRYLNPTQAPVQLGKTVEEALHCYQYAEQLHQRIEALQQQNQSLTNSNTELGKALNNLQLSRVCAGVYWLQIPQADLYILCGCPADVVKHLKQKGYIAETDKGETGPNAILLSDCLIQQGDFANLAEFPVLQMLYLQGMLVPNHPNNKGVKPILIGTSKQVTAQMQYIYRGNYGLVSEQEIIDAGIEPKLAHDMMRIKLNFAFGEIKATQELLDSCIVDEQHQWHPIRNQVSIRRNGFNKFEFEYKDESVEVDLNLDEEEHYDSPYQLNYHAVTRNFFSVLHSGEGDGWDTKRPAMSSIVFHQGDIYLIDAGPNIVKVLYSVGIDISEISGIFHTHCHDDHFCGLPVLMQADHRIKYYATALVRASVTKKLSALMSIDESDFHHYFDVVDLEYEQWNNINGLEVKPLFSPHPVETSLFVFRAAGGEGYRTYGHWADLTSFTVLNQMIEETTTKPGICRAWHDEIKQTYLTPMNLKKIDIGGGLIHGLVEDYVDDRSDKIILAHTEKSLTPEQKEVGSNAAFASVDVLIDRKDDYLRSKAMACLQQYFPEASLAQLSSFLNGERRSFNPGETILARGGKVNELFLLAAGTMEKIQDGHSVFLSTGSFIGEASYFSGMPSEATFRSISHIELFCFSHDICKIFLESSGLVELITELQTTLNTLNNSWLFEEGLSTLVKNRIARSMQGISLSAGESLDKAPEYGLFLLDSGEAKVLSGCLCLETHYYRGEYFGEQYLLEKSSEWITITAISDVKLFFIPGEVLHDIPLVFWKLLEKSGAS